MLGPLLNQMGNVLFTSPRARTVLIHADHRRRDAPAALLIGYYLRDLGYNVVVGNRAMSRTWYYLFRPEVVLTTHPDTIFSPKELAEESRHCRFVLMHPESAGMIREGMLMHMRGGWDVSDAYTRHYARVLTWGPLLKEWVVDAGLYPEAFVEPVGSARYDFYRVMQRVPREERTLGALPSFGGLSHHANVCEVLHNTRTHAGIHFGQGGGYEDFVWAAAAYVRLFLEFLDVWCLELKRPIAFRPYLLERQEDYVFFRKRYGAYFLEDVRSPFPRWLVRRSGSLFCFSSSVCESIASGVPYITLQSVIEDRLEYHQPRAELTEIRGEIYDYTHRPKSIPEVVDLATKADAATLDLAVEYGDSPGLQKILWTYWGWPRPEPTSRRVAQVIHELMEATPALNHSATRRRLLQEFVKAPGRAWLLSERGTLTRTFHDFHFMPWHREGKR